MQSSTCTTCTRGSKPNTAGTAGMRRALSMGVSWSVPITFAKRKSVTDTCGLSSAKSRT